MISDFLYIFHWWGVVFLIGIIFLPLTIGIFSNFFDRGYIFAKVLGMGIITYAIFLLGTVKILPFTEPGILLTVFTSLVFNIFLMIKYPNILTSLKGSLRIFIFEELLFFIALLCWSFVRAHEPSIHGLEKFMDFGFVNSILQTDFFPAKDLWLTPETINYYYFGHVVTAVLTKLSGIDPSITYNLMIVTLFALTFTGVFSIGANLTRSVILSKRSAPKDLLAGLLSAFLVTLAGNLHSIYAFFQPYNVEHPVPFWQLVFSPATFPNAYWYPNATRFIANTIHEFPIYSFVVSDLHGHVLDIPFVLVTIAVLLNIVIAQRLNLSKIVLLGFLLAVMYMTNVWDGLIYAGLISLVFAYLAYQAKNYTLFATRYVLIVISAVLLTLPFSLYFKPFASGIGVVCAPEFLTNLGKLGPFLFEPNHCLRSPLWQLLILYGFFYFWVIVFFLNVILSRSKAKAKDLTGFFANAQNDIFIVLLILISTLLIIVPEFFYAKDIYPLHYRANTMFKLVYQAFIMLSIVSGYTIVKVVLGINRKILTICYLLLTPCLPLIVFIYPYLAITSYYGNLETYQGLDGLMYLQKLYPSDYEAILWLKKNMKGQPVILEAQGDSYTDYARVSANTGLPTVIGWPVHEWLWRGSYDVASTRISDVQTIYETEDVGFTRQVMSKYGVSLVFIGELERRKYSNLNEEKFGKIGKVIYENNKTKIYQLL